MHSNPSTVARRCRRVLSTAATAAVALLAAAAPAHADLILADEVPPPSLLEYATGTPQLRSRALAVTTLRATGRAPVCTSSYAFWECRTEIDRQDWIEPDNRSEEIEAGRGLARATRDAFSFDGLDYSVAEARARAQSDYRRNRAEVVAEHAGRWSETRVNGAWDGATETQDGFVSHGLAVASSLWADAFTPSIDDVLTLRFAVEQHGRGLGSPFVVPDPSFTPYDGWADGRFSVQVFDLGQITQYGLGDGAFVEGPALVAVGELDRTGEDGAGRVWLELMFSVLAGRDYALVADLTLSAEDNGWLDMFGTATLAEIRVGAGQALRFASGTAYDISGPSAPGVVPEPGSLALLLAGLASMAGVARRRVR